MLLDFIYRGEVSIPPNLIPDLVKIGSDMRVRGLCDFVWNESMVSTAFQGYANESRPSVPRSNEMPSNSAHLNPQSSSFGGNSTISSRSLENLLRQQSDQLSPCYSQVNNPAAEGRAISSGETQNSSSSNSVQPRSFPGSAVKRIRVLPPAAAITETVTTDNVQNRLDLTSNSDQDVDDPNLMMMTNDGQFLHIDFAYSFGDKTLIIDTPHFPIPWAICSFLKHNKVWEDFKELCWKSLQCLKDYHSVFKTIAMKFPFDPSRLEATLKCFENAFRISKEAYFSSIEEGPWLKLPKDIVHAIEQGKIQFITNPINGILNLVEDLVGVITNPNTPSCSHQFNHIKGTPPILYCTKCAFIVKA